MLQLTPGMFQQIAIEDDSNVMQKLADRTLCAELY